MSPYPHAQPNEATAVGETARVRDAWLDLLDGLERAAAATGDMAAAVGPGETSGGPVRWAPPTDIGPLPADLAERAARLIRAQTEAVSRLGSERARVMRHLGAVRAVEPARPARESVYLDTLG